jgi:hypothetical protein
LPRRRGRHAEIDVDVHAGHELGPRAEQLAVGVLVVLHPDVDEQHLDADQPAVAAAARPFWKALSCWSPATPAPPAPPPWASRRRLSRSAWAEPAARSDRDERE